MDKMQEYAEKIAKTICDGHSHPSCNPCSVAKAEADLIINDDLSEVFAHASAYEKLLEQTREKCTNCDGMGFHYVNDETDQTIGERKCDFCHGTGYIEHPERIVVVKEGDIYKHRCLNPDYFPGNNEGEK